MNSRERTFAALKHQKTDRPPFSFWQHMRQGEGMGDPCVDAHIRFVQETGVDFLKVMSDGMKAPFDTDSIQTAKDWLKLRPLFSKNPYTTEMLTRAAKICEALSSQVVIQLNIFAPFSLIRRVGDEKIMAHIAEDPAAVKHAMDVIAQEQAYMAEKAVTEAGCDGNLICFQGAELNRFTPDQFDEFVRPYDMQVLNSAMRVSDVNILHFCGWDEWKNRFSLWREYPGQAVNWAIYVDGMDLVRGHDYFGGRPVFGGFDNRKKGLLCSENKRVIQEETLRIVQDYREATGSTDGLMIGADCSFRPDVDRERFIWVREALEQTMN